MNPVSISPTSGEMATLDNANETRWCQFSAKVIITITIIIISSLSPMVQDLMLIFDESFYHPLPPIATVMLYRSPGARSGTQRCQRCSR